MCAAMAAAAAAVERSGGFHVGADLQRKGLEAVYAGRHVSRAQLWRWRAPRQLLGQRVGHGAARLFL